MEWSCSFTISQSKFNYLWLLFPSDSLLCEQMKIKKKFFSVTEKLRNRNTGLMRILTTLVSLSASLGSLSALGFSQSADTMGRLLMKCPTLLPSLFTGIFSEELLLIEAKSLTCQWRVLEWEKKHQNRVRDRRDLQAGWARQESRSCLSPSISSLHLMPFLQVVWSLSFKIGLKLPQGSADHD